MSTPIISLVGRPNVGKSTIFNRILGNSYKAITQDKPGVTRDRHYGLFKLDSDEDAIIIDTGGFYPEYDESDEKQMFSVMAEQARLAIRESDLVLIVVDVRDGLLPFDESIVEFTRKEKKDFWLVINKYDTDKQMGDEGEFYKLSASEFILTSAEHARGISELKERINDFCLTNARGNSKISQGVIPNFPLAGRVALIGAPNAGKSTLLNQLIGETRAVVSSVAGTTVDPIEGFIDVDFGDDGKHFAKDPFHFRKDAVGILSQIQKEEVLEESLEQQTFSPFRSVMMVDTAGIRRKSHINEELEAQSVYRSLRAITDCDVVLYLIDGARGMGHQDKKLIGIAIEKGKSVIIAINKIDTDPEVFSDKKAKKEYLLDFQYDLPWLSYCLPFFISAKNNWGIAKLKDELLKTLVLRKKYIPTGILNKALQELFEKNPISVNSKGHTRLKLKYGAMVKANPPTFLLFTNRSKGIPIQYRRYLVNGLRKTFDFPNTPVHVVIRKDGEKREGIDA
jgi:GTP-binding protein